MADTARSVAAIKLRLMAICAIDKAVAGGASMDTVRRLFGDALVKEWGATVLGK